MLSGTENFTLSDEMIKRIESLSDSVRRSIKFTPEQDYIITTYYKQKSKADLARLLGVSENTMRKRYKELNEKI